MNAILLSGGLDSTSIAYWIKPDFAFTIDYGQNSAEAEIEASKSICKRIGINHEIITVDIRSIGSGDLINKSQSVIAPKSDWWPFRNQLLITIASSYILSNNLDIDEIIFGSVRNDSYHTDGKKEFFDHMNKLLQFQEGSLKVSTPAIDLTAVELIKKSNIPLSLLSWSNSCHKARYACGNCRGCYKQQNVFHELGYIL